jgi:hypothetical protein
VTNRRQFIRIGIATSTLPFAGHAARAAGIHDVPAADQPVLPLYKVLYDTRFAESVAFARRATALGLVTHAIEGDMTRFWYDDLYHRWRTGAAVIAGLTAHGALFCLERLAWDQGMRVVLRVEHRFDDSAISHSIAGPESVLRAARDAAAERNWSAAMADVVNRCPSGRAVVATCNARTMVATQRSNSAESLYSWVIAPARKIGATAA